MKLKRLSIFLITVLLQLPVAQACTVAFWNNNGEADVFARSMDLYISDQPNIVVSPRGIERNGGAGADSLKWKAKYGSIAVTAFNTETVSDGINEQGLGAHLLYLHTTQYEKRDPARPALSNMLWARYCLDNFTSVDEALENINQLQVVSTKLLNKEWPIHLVLEDAAGDSAVIEFINGEMKIYHGHDYTVATNEPAYNIQLANLKRYKLFGGTLSMPGDIDPLSRFVRASSYLKTLPKAKNNIEALAGILSVIRTVMVPFGAVDTSENKPEDTWATRWITLGDLSNRVFYFSSTTAPNIVWLELDKLNISEGAPILIVDPTATNLVGDISKSLHKK